MKFLRWLIGIIIGLFILIVIALVLLVNFVNPNDYRDQINTLVSNKTHQKFVIAGDITWALFPSFGFKIQNIHLGDMQDHKNLAAEINAMNISLKLWPLLHKKIDLDALQVDGLNLHLPTSSPTSKSVNASPSHQTLGALASIPRFALLELSIKNANITSFDNDGKPTLQIENASLKASHIAPDTAFPLAISGRIITPNTKFDIHFTSDIALNTQTPALNLSNSKLTIDILKESKPLAHLNINANNIEANMNTHQLTLDKLTGDVAGLNLTANATVTDIDTAPNATGDVHMESSNLKNAITPFISLPNTIINTLTQFKLDTQYHYSDNALALTALNTTIDNNHLEGSLKSNDLKNMAWQINLQSPQLQLGDYLASDANGKKQTVTLSNIKTAINFLPPAISDENFTNSSITGTLEIQALNYNNLPVKNVTLTTDSKQGIIQITKFHAEAWQGRFDGNANINLKTNIPSFSINPNIQGIQLASLLAWLEPKLHMTGTASVSGNISSAGSSLQSIKQHLNGHLNTEIKNGIWYGLDLAYWLNAGSALLHKESLPAQSQSKQTTFGDLTASLLINQGVINNQDLLLKGPVVIAKGQGSIDLNRESLNYRLQVYKTNSNTGQAHSDYIPLIISGTFDNPSVQPDMNLLAQQILVKQKDKLLGKLGAALNNTDTGKSLNDAANQLIGKLLG